MNKKLKIGFVGNLFGTPKGHSYVANNMVNAIMDAGHETHMYRLNNNAISDEFRKPTSLKSNTSMIISKEDFEAWLDEIKPDYCVFNEYAQWWSEDHDKLEICKDRGIKTVGYLVWEKLDWNKKDHYKLYTTIIAPTGFQTKLFRKHGLYNAVHVPWGTDIDEIDAVEIPKRNKDDRVRFYHCAGSGGIGDRKNTQTIIDAFELIKDESVELMITHLGSKIFSRNEIIAFMKQSDVLVNTSRWDTIGLNTLEANACGIPVIVADTEPMNELVIDNTNGIVVPGDETTCDAVTCPVFNVDVDALSQKMSIFKNKTILNMLKRNSRAFAEVNFNWKLNKENFIKVFK